MKKNTGYKKLYSGYNGSGRDVYVINSSYDTFKHILKEYRNNYDMTSIMRKVVSLNANPLQGKGTNPAGDICTSKSGNISMQYSLHNGAVYISYMQISKPEVNKGFGLYPVIFDKRENIWVPERDSVVTIDKKQQWKSKAGKAHYAAVAGRFDSKDDAGHLLSEHLIGAYTKSDYLTSSDAEADFSMFWLEKGQHKSAEAAQSLASIMQQNSFSDLPVNWLVHDVATDTFKAAVKIFKTTPQAKKASEAAAYSQNVYFSNPNTSSKKALEKLCIEAGLGFVGLNTNNRDLRRFSTFKNAGMEISKTASIAVSVGGASGLTVAAKTMGAGAMEKVINNGFAAMLSGNHIALVASIVATGFIAVGVFNKSKTVTASMHCTFGKGNQKWYTSDDELLA
ncbi:hypothetical protein MNBD_GAMMA09-3327 [hydrothermal vent metagenome]|uniref:Uncharacterized protein n=1 Tax=hydrothermal vent metagenome TaxID=652676 RepID=A0A3B0Y1M6_9ZZZZ